MMNSLRRKTSLRPKSRPALMSFIKHDQYSNTSQYCEPNNTVSPRANMPHINYEYPVYNTNNKYASAPKHCRNNEYDHENDVNLNNTISRRSSKLPQEDYYNQTKTPYDRHHEPLKATAELSQHRTNHCNIYERQQLYPTDSYDGGRKQESRRVLRRQSTQEGRAWPSATSQSGQCVPSAGVTRTVQGVVKRRKHVVLLGLDGSGKTTVLMQLKYRCCIATTPTVGFNHEKVWAGGFRWSAWDVGGGERVRPLWATYTRGTDGIVYVVDAAASTDTMEETRLELARVIKLSKATSGQLGKPAPPLLVLANFQDMRGARHAPEVAECLSLPQEGDRPVSPCWAVACVCATTGEGLDEALGTLRHLMDRGTQVNKTKTHPLDRF